MSIISLQLHIAVSSSFDNCCTCYQSIPAVKCFRWESMSPRVSKSTDYIRPGLLKELEKKEQLACNIGTNEKSIYRTKRC